MEGVSVTVSHLAKVRAVGVTINIYIALLGNANTVNTNVSVFTVTKLIGRANLICSTGRIDWSSNTAALKRLIVARSFRANGVALGITVAINATLNGHTCSVNENEAFVTGALLSGRARGVVATTGSRAGRDTRALNIGTLTNSAGFIATRVTVRVLPTLNNNAPAINVGEPWQTGTLLLFSALGTWGTGVAFRGILAKALL